jgi:hypothetical protein
MVGLEHLHGSAGGKQLPRSFAIYEVRDGRIAQAWFSPAK